MKHTNLKIKLSVLVITITLIIAMVLPFAACTDDNKLQTQIDDLKIKIEQLEEQIRQLEEEEQNSKPEDEAVITGQFYTLEDAYNQNIITTQNLQQIADYHNNGLQSDGPLSDELATTIKTAWAEKLQNEEGNLNPPATEDTIKIYKFYGTYNGCTIIMLDYAYSTYTSVYMPTSIEIGGVTLNFDYPGYVSQLVAWKC